MTTSEMTPADFAAVAGNNDGFGGNNGIWWLALLFLFSWGGFGGYGSFGNRGGGNYATQSDVRAAVDQQTLISKLDQQTYGLADSTYALNNAITPIPSCTIPMTDCTEVALRSIRCRRLQKNFKSMYTYCFGSICYFRFDLPD